MGAITLFTTYCMCACMYACVQFVFHAVPKGDLTVLVCYTALQDINKQHLVHGGKKTSPIHLNW